MQVATFQTGGMVVHKIRPHGFTCRVSAWFDAAGVMLDAEAFDGANRPRPVKRNGPMWAAVYAAARHLLPH